MIKTFNSPDDLSAEEKREIAVLITSVFRKKLLPIFVRIEEDRWPEFFEKILLYNKGLYYKDEKGIQGVGMLQTESADLVQYSRKVKKTLGFPYALIMKIFFSHKVKPGILRLEMLGVSEAVRGQGIGSKLMKELPRIAREEGYHTLSLDVVDTNPRAKKLYESLGYKTVKTIKTGFLSVRAGFSASYLMECPVE
ncbi:MAG: GNAT family N-acetyltransferase [Spirochaetales bacterium]|nr:GNAT family N-acetyltransferase [Spirochaetales bacterium]